MFDIIIPQRRIIALDADGVLLDYNKAAAAVWHSAFGAIPAIKDPTAYHFRNAYDIDLSDRLVHAKYYDAFGKTAWGSMPAMPHAVEGCQMLHDLGYELHVVSSMPVGYADQRAENLRALGMPIASVTATGRVEGGGNPKLAKLLELGPVAFVDDLLSNFEGVHDRMHCAYLHWDSVDNPNQEHEHALKSSTHPDMLSFARYWSMHDDHTAWADAQSVCLAAA